MTNFRNYAQCFIWILAFNLLSNIVKICRMSIVVKICLICPQQKLRFLVAKISKNIRNIKNQSEAVEKCRTFLIENVESVEKCQTVCRKYFCRIKQEIELFKYYRLPA